ncbi:MAG: hypothetical protein NXI24_11810 [bacterium]|nr:hypothetical protein [bacterium]
MAALILSGPGADRLQSEGAEFQQPEMSPLNLAVNLDDLATVRRLLKAGADPNGTHPKTLLMNAIGRNHEEVALALIAAGADIEYRGWNIGSPPLLMAAHFEANRVIAGLLISGADPDGANAAEFTALMGVAFTGDLVAAHMLLDAGARVDRRSLKGVTVLHCIDPKRFNPKLMRLFIDRGANVNAVTVDRKVFRQVEEQLLRDWQVPFSEPGFFDLAEKTPLMIAARHGIIDAAKMLLERGADLHFENSYGESATYMAREAGHEEMLQFLERVAAEAAER